MYSDESIRYFESQNHSLKNRNIIVEKKRKSPFFNEARLSFFDDLRRLVCVCIYIYIYIYTGRMHISSVAIFTRAILAQGRWGQGLGASVPV
jgi:hypothetical protein